MVIGDRIIKLAKILTDPAFCIALFKGVAAGVEHIPVLRNLYCNYIVDVGANRGQFALISRKVFPTASIHSFEPLEEPAKIFKKVFAGDESVTLHPYAIGPQVSTSVIHVSSADDSSSLLPITSLQTQLYPGTGERETRQVQVFPLSQVLDKETIPPSSLLKLDVQGYELEVLKGCESILNKFSYTYIECSFIELYQGQALAHSIIAWLKDRNFILTGVYNLSYDSRGKALQGDFFFKNIDVAD